MVSLLSDYTVQSSRIFPSEKASATRLGGITYDVNGRYLLLKKQTEYKGLLIISATWVTGGYTLSFYVTRMNHLWLSYYISINSLQIEPNHKGQFELITECSIGGQNWNYELWERNIWLVVSYVVEFESLGRYIYNRGPVKQFDQPCIYLNNETMRIWIAATDLISVFPFIYTIWFKVND